MFKALFVLSLIVTKVYAQSNPYFLYNGTKYQLEWSYLSKAAEKRIFYPDKNRKKRIDEFLSSRPISSANIKGMMSKVRSQGTRGTCSNFTTLGLLEPFIDKNADYSEQCLAYHSSQDDSGVTEDKLKYIIGNGIYHEVDCPYVNPTDFADWYMADDKKRESLKLLARNKLPNLDTAKKIYPPFKTIEQAVDGLTDGQYIAYIQNHLNNNIPIAASFFSVGDEWGTGLITTIPTEEEIKKQCEKTASSSSIKKCSSHGVVLTGYDDSRRLIFFKNSWGEDWGLNEQYILPKDFKDKIGYGAFSYEYLAKFRLNSLVTLYN